jgi:hypothetical protein
LWSVSSGLGFFLIARWFWWRINSWSEISALISSILLSVVFYFMDFLKILEIDFKLKLIIIPISILVGLLVTFLTKPENDNVLEKFYNQIKPSGFWRQKNSNENIVAPLFKAFQLSISILILIFGFLQLAIGNFYMGIGAIIVGSLILLLTIKDIKS